ncbi:MAG: DUF4340 domain-containing protein [Candidatus Omnitrophica bacterium]|nr:DUF4340 domain-containing protein [Candidatus Omnitrophota bacterium]
MNWKTTVVLLVIAIGVGFFYFWDVENVEQEKKIEKQKEELILTEKEDIMKLSLERPNQDTITAVREGEEWNLTEPVEWPADKFAWDAIASSLSSAKIARTFPDEGETLSEDQIKAWGLDPAGLTVAATVREGSEEYKFGFGNTLPNSDSSVYGTSSDLEDKVVVVSKAVINNASKDLHSLREKKYLNVHFERDKPSLIAVSNKDLQLVAEKNAENDWTITSPERMKGDPANLRKFVEKLGLESIKIIDDVSDEKLKSVGLAEDQLASATSYRVGFGGEGAEKTFYVGAFDPTEGGHLGRRAGARNLFVIDKDFFDEQPTKLEELRPKKAITIQKWNAEVVSATSNGKPLFDLRKQDFNWRMTSPHSATAERGAIDKLVDAFNDYKIMSFVSSASSLADLGLDEPILSLTIGGKDATETIHFGNHDGIGGIYASWEGMPDKFVMDQGVLDKVLLNPLDLLTPDERERIAPAPEEKAPETGTTVSAPNLDVGEPQPAEPAMAATAEAEQSQPAEPVMESTSEAKDKAE